MDALFCSLELAARIERAEASLLWEAATAVAGRHPDRPSFLASVGGGTASLSAPNSPLNKVAGVGFGGEVAESDWEGVEAACFSAGVRVQVEVSTAADPGLARELSGRGYRLTGHENVSGLALANWLPAVGRGGQEVRVARAGEGERAAWLDAVVEGFAVPDGQGVEAHESFPKEVLAEVIEDFTSAASMRNYLARFADRDAVLGGGSMRIEGPLAQLCGAATRPEARRRGVQSALLDHRLSEARDAGCDLVVVTTQPGSASEQNMRRIGFQLLYARAVLVREAPGAEGT